MEYDFRTAVYYMKTAWFLYSLDTDRDTEELVLIMIMTNAVVSLCMWIEMVYANVLS